MCNIRHFLFLIRSSSRIEIFNTLSKKWSIKKVAPYQFESIVAIKKRYIYSLNKSDIQRLDTLRLKDGMIRIDLKLPHEPLLSSMRRFIFTPDNINIVICVI